MPDGNVTAGGAKKLYRGRMKATAPLSGATADRPTVGFVGTQYFDTDLGLPIWVSDADAAVTLKGGTINAWVDATGADPDAP